MGSFTGHMSCKCIKTVVFRVTRWPTLTARLQHTHTHTPRGAAQPHSTIAIRVTYRSSATSEHVMITYSSVAALSRHTRCPGKPTICKIVLQDAQTK